VADPKDAQIAHLTGLVQTMTEQLANAVTTKADDGTPAESPNPAADIQFFDETSLQEAMQDPKVMNAALAKLATVIAQVNNDAAANLVNTTIDTRLDNASKLNQFIGTNPDLVTPTVKPVFEAMLRNEQTISPNDSLDQQLAKAALSTRSALGAAGAPTAPVPPAPATGYPQYPTQQPGAPALPGGTITAGQQTNAPPQATVSDQIMSMVNNAKQHQIRK